MSAKNIPPNVKYSKAGDVLNALDMQAATNWLKQAKVAITSLVKVHIIQGNMKILRFFWSPKSNIEFIRIPTILKVTLMPKIQSKYLTSKGISEFFKLVKIVS